MKEYLKKYGTHLLVSAIACVITFGATSMFFVNYTNTLVNSLDEYDAAFKKLAYVSEVYKEIYVGGELDDQKMMDGAMYGLVAGTGDKYGSYFSEKEFTRLMENNKGDLVGIGVSVVSKVQDGYLKVMSVFENSPAQKAGIIPGDKIIGANDKMLTDIGYYMLVDEILGEKGTEVTVHLLRDDKQEDLKIVRDIVVMESVKIEQVKEFAKITITEFNKKTPEQFKEAIDKAQKLSKTKGIIFDVRNNGGGDSEAIAEILDILLPKGNIYKLVSKNGETVSYDSDANEIIANMVVLTNENTASAAELFAAAMQDYGKAKIVGQTTFGKGTGISIMPLNDGTGLAISDTLFYTPSGRNLEGVGVIPDYEVEMTEEQFANFYDLTPDEDPQMKKAMELLK